MYIIDKLPLSQVPKSGKLKIVLPKGNFTRLPDWCFLTQDVVVTLEIILNKLQTENEICLLASSEVEFSAVCQRCLEEMIEKISLSITGKKRTEQDKNFYFSHEDNFDTQNTYCKNNELDVIRLCEDELLLVLPMVPKHEFDCGPPLYLKNVKKINKPNPFASLLKNKDKN
ncbi:MAG: hypothetical protein CBC29_01640 [Methylococcaceae bacterium TMED69]|nr:MAG: hypothetical protein CBC29_01640 [Methylococcaceae bacterium TMED69]|tara:strand:- start:1724 stop:2236 length:513 start_codon:yes stop_codon:yes gene_type:complete